MSNRTFKHKTDPIPVKAPRPWHPYLFGLFPILYLFAENTLESSPDQVIGPILVVLSAIALLVGLVNLFVRNIRKSSMIASVLVLYFFSWGHLPVGFRHHKNVLAYVLGFVVIAAIVSALRSRSSLSKATLLANRLSMGLVLLQVGLGTAWAILNRRPLQEYDLKPIAAAPVETDVPNIYYIVPDSYARSDVLASIYGYDNSEFISYLRDLGFYVADSSFCNYPRTLLSLTSSLNLEMIQQLGTLDPDSRDLVGFSECYADNRLYRFLKQHDYKIVAFHVTTSVIESDQADYLFRPWYDLSEFSNVLYRTTPLAYAADRFAGYNMLRQRILYILDKVAHLDEVEEPYFVMAHITCPHPPFLWDEEGNENGSEQGYYKSASAFLGRGGTRDEFVKGFRNQTRVIDRLLRQTVDGILSSHGGDPPVILIQSDTGPDLYFNMDSLEEADVGERFPILNAYFLPGVDTSDLYPTISPVNSFRVVLNTYFGTELPLVEDRAFYSTWARPFDMVEVTDSLLGSR